MTFVRIVFMWTGFLFWYVALACALGRLLKAARIAQLGP